MNAQTQKFLDIFNTIDFDRIKDHQNILIAANFWEEERFPFNTTISGTQIQTKSGDYF